MEHGVGVGEDLLRGDAVLPGQGLEVVSPLPPVVVVDLVDAPLGDVADPLPGIRVTVEGKTLHIHEQLMFH